MIAQGAPFDLRINAMKPCFGYNVHVHDTRAAFFIGRQI